MNYCAMAKEMAREKSKALVQTMFAREKTAPRTISICKNILFIGSQQHLDTFCGSPPYAAPELFSDDHYIGGPVDVWALGVLVYFMVVGNMPFRAPTVPALRSAVLKGDYSLPAHISVPCTRLIRMNDSPSPDSIFKLKYCYLLHRTNSSPHPIKTSDHRPNASQPMGQPSVSAANRSGRPRRRRRTPIEKIHLVFAQPKQHAAQRTQQ